MKFQASDPEFGTLSFETPEEFDEIFRRASKEEASEVERWLKEVMEEVMKKELIDFTMAFVPLSIVVAAAVKAKATCEAEG